MLLRRRLAGGTTAAYLWVMCYDGTWGAVPPLALCVMLRVDLQIFVIFGYMVNITILALTRP